MSSELSRLLQDTIDRELPYLRALSEHSSSIKPNGDDSWSPKQELGHLIDSATNNHQRFVRAALADEYRGPGYAQTAWVEINEYQETAWADIVSIWYQYNSLLVRTIRNIAQNKLATPCFIGEVKASQTLGFLIEDYVLHMRHHLDHLLKREHVTDYPAKASPMPLNTAV